MSELAFRGWMYDVAREQSPPQPVLVEMFERSLAAGYNAVGVYLEHRFDYASAPQVAPVGCLTPERIGQLCERFGGKGLRIIPFLNILGHMEGFIGAPGGGWLAEERSASTCSGLFEAPRSAQICPSRQACREFVQGLVADAMEAFDDEWVHLGGDETKQLGVCPFCAERASKIGLAGVYGEHVGELCRQVIRAGRRPCLWGDMLGQHPGAMEYIPAETIIFDWQYDSRPADTTRVFRDRGFDVVCCPSVQTYNSGWCFLNATRRNIDEHVFDARLWGALGVLVTTWEFSFFSNYASIMPVIYSAGRRLANNHDWDGALESEGGSAYARAAEILGNRIPRAAPFLEPGTWRQLREHLIMRGNPFDLWRVWRDAACGVEGDEILRLCDEAATILASDESSPHSEALRFPVELHRTSVRWVRLVDRAFEAFACGGASAAAPQLREGVALFERLRPGLEQAAALGGSDADPRRLGALIETIRTAERRLSMGHPPEQGKQDFASVVLSETDPLQQG